MDHGSEDGGLWRSRKGKKAWRSRREHPGIVEHKSNTPSRLTGGRKVREEGGHTGQEGQDFVHKLVYLGDELSEFTMK